MMSDLIDFLGRVLRGTLALLLWLMAAALALGLLLVAMVVLLVGALWALLRGRRPTRPVFVGRFQQFTRTRVWPGPGGSAPGGGPGHRPGGHTEVLDVEVREVPEQPPRG